MARGNPHPALVEALRLLKKSQRGTDRGRPPAGSAPPRTEAEGAGRPDRHSSARCTAWPRNATRFGDRATMSYEHVEREAAKPKRVVDHSARWAKLKPVGETNGIAPTGSPLLRVEADHASRRSRRSAPASRSTRRRRRARLGRTRTATAPSPRSSTGRSAARSHDSTPSSRRPGCGRS